MLCICARVYIFLISKNKSDIAYLFVIDLLIQILWFYALVPLLFVQIYYFMVGTRTANTLLKFIIIIECHNASDICYVSESFSLVLRRFPMVLTVFSLGCGC